MKLEISFDSNVGKEFPFYEAKDILIINGSLCFKALDDRG